MAMIVRYAQAVDKDKLLSFLRTANLGTDGIENLIEYFLIMEDDSGEIQATLGIEPIGQQGLLRSFATTSRIGENELLFIFEQMLKLAREKELEKLYLASNRPSSPSFFSLLGFEREENLPQELTISDHVSHILNVDNSVFMGLKLK